MQHEIIASFPLYGVDDLRVTFCTKSRDDQCLCFASRKQNRTMGAWEQASFYTNRPDRLEIAAIDTRLLG